ncbi:MAG: hypothetical protein JST83_00295 [Bacteroidetes bacterium]|nr:hypothetical protein [Bacteroidota bacterium]
MADELINRISRKIRRIWLSIAIRVHNSYYQAFGLARLRTAVKNCNAPLGFESYNAPAGRQMEVQPSDRDLSQVILGCYFIHQQDPIQGIIRRRPDINYIAPWYNSICKLGLTGVIVHDGLDEDFIREHETDRILFRRYRGGHYSIFEERWFAYYMWLSLSGVQRAFIADMNDVYITRDPFTLQAEELTLYVGRDIANKIKDSGWLLAEQEQYCHDAGYQVPYLYPYQYVYNAGVVGGFRPVLLMMMSYMIRRTMQTMTTAHKDMTLLNLFIYEHFFPHIDTHLDSPRLATRADDLRAAHRHLITGYPFNSDFQKLQLDSDAFFIHK